MGVYELLVKYIFSAINLCAYEKSYVWYKIAIIRTYFLDDIFDLKQQIWVFFRTTSSEMSRMTLVHFRFNGWWIQMTLIEIESIIEIDAPMCP